METHNNNNCLKTSNSNLQTISLKKFFIIKKIHAFILLISIIFAFIAIVLFSLMFALFKRNNEQIIERCASSVSTSKPIFNNNTIAIRIKNPQINEIKEKIDYRLPINLKPYYYDIHISTRFHDTIEPTDFNGTVKIYFKCLTRTNMLILHMKDIDIYNSTIVLKGLTNTSFEYYHLNWLYDREKEFLIFELSKDFEVNHNYTIIIKYKGYLQDDNIGFYRSSYFDNQGKRK